MPPAPDRPSARTTWIHVAGAMANLALTAVSTNWLVLNHASAGVAGWISIFAMGIFVADVVSGVLHWTFDTWFDVHSEALRRMVISVRRHHLYPKEVLLMHFWEDAGVLSWFGALLVVPPLVANLLLRAAPSTLRFCITGASVVASLLVAFMLEFHKLGHRYARSRLLVAAQRLGLLLSPDHHGKHHRGNHDRNYCLINGIADRTLGAIGLFRWLERAVHAVTGAVPRLDDEKWRLRHGRS